jgi:hypothetical protein
MLLGLSPRPLSSFWLCSNPTWCLFTNPRALPSTQALLALLSRYAFVLVGGAGVALGVTYHTALSHVGRSAGLVYTPALLLGHRHVHTFFDGFFFPLRTHRGYNLFYSTPKQRPPRGLASGARRRLRSPLTRPSSSAPRHSFFSHVGSLPFSDQEHAHAAPQRPAPRFRHYRGALGSFSLATQPAGYEAAVDRSTAAPSFSSKGDSALATHPLFTHRRRGDRRVSLQGVKRRTVSPFASYEATMSKWSLVAARFKPGLSTEWRGCRAAFNRAWGLGFTRQHRLTRFVLSLRHFWGFSFLRVLSLSLGRLARLSYLSLAATCPDLSHSVRVGFWLVNGVRTSNPFLQIFVGDYFSPFTDPVALSGARCALYDQISLFRYHRYLQLQALVHAPLALAIDTPPFLEVDELAVTASLLYEPRGADFFLDPQVSAAPYLTVRMYN